MRIRRVLAFLVALGVGIGAVVAGARYRSRRTAPRGGGEPLESMTKGELYERARAAEIPGRSEMTKDELIKALRSHRS